MGMICSTNEGMRNGYKIFVEENGRDALGDL